MTEPKQTAVEWLFQVIPYRLFLTEDGIKAIKAQALEIEREYIAEAKQDGFSIGFDEGFKQGKESNMSEQTLWIVLREGKVIPGIVATTHRDALQQLGRWITPYDIAISGSLLHDLGREATREGNPFSCESIVVNVGETNPKP